MRIKVTGYIEADDLPAAHVDPSHEMGLSEEGYNAQAVSGPQTLRLSVLDDLEFERVDD